ncbi:MAG: hypothetical protein PHQ27_00860 [Victivallales bacterium]|nr:hypothetical protein [Victivallales bacterium]
MSKWLKALRNIVEYAPLFCLYQFIRCLPLPVIVAFSRLCGWTVYIIPGFYKLTTANIRTAFPELPAREVGRIARHSMANITRTILEFFWFANAPERVEKHVVIHDEARRRIAEHVKRGERIIFVSPHLGNWEATGLKMSLSSGLDFAVVVRPQRNPFINRLIRRSRQSCGGEVIDAKGAVKKMLRAVRNGKSMATLIDQNTRVRDGGVFVDFFGLPVPSSRAPALFARLPGVQVYVGGGIHTPDGKITTFLNALPRPAAEYESETAMIQDLMRLTEAVIRRYPEQYLWLYKRFQYIPPDARPEIRRRFPYYAATAPDKFFFKKRLPSDGN